MLTLRRRYICSKQSFSFSRQESCKAVFFWPCLRRVGGLVGRHQNGNLEGSHNKQDIVLHNDFYSVSRQPQIFLTRPRAVLNPVSCGTSCGTLRGSHNFHLTSTVHTNNNKDSTSRESCAFIIFHFQHKHKDKVLSIFIYLLQTIAYSSSSAP